MRAPRCSPGPLGLLLVAVVAIPELLRHCKPLAKSVGDFLVKAGNEVHRLAEDPAPAPSPSPSPAPDAPSAAGVKTEAAETDPGAEDPPTAAAKPRKGKKSGAEEA